MKSMGDVYRHKGRTFSLVVMCALFLVFSGCAEDEFNIYDSNGDGTISLTEWTDNGGSKDEFNNSDQNNDGVLSSSEFGSGGGGGNEGGQTVNFAKIEISPSDVISVPFSGGIGSETPQTITIINSGSADLLIDSLKFDYTPVTADETDGVPAFRLGSVRGCGSAGCSATWNAENNEVTAPAGEPINIGADGLPYSYVEVDVIFHRPETVEPRAGTLTIKSNADGSTTKLVTFQTQVANARIAVAPAEVDFGSVASGEEPGLPLTIQNIGTDILEISKMEFTGSPFYSIEIDGVEYKPGDVIDFSAAPVQIPLGEPKVYTVYFRPESADPSTASLNIFSNDSEAPPGGTEVVMKGNTSGPCISVNPKTLNFGGKVIGQLSVLPVEIQSCGSSPLVITGIKLAEDSSTDFSLDFESLGEYGVDVSTGPTGDNPLTIPINQDVELNVRFVPDAENPKDENGQPIPDIGTILVSNNTFDAELPVTVQGIGVDVNCPVAVIYIQEGEQVIPQTNLHLFGDQSYSPAGAIKKWEWSVEQPLGSQSVFLPSANFPDPTFEANVAGSFLFQLTVLDENDTPSCVPAEAQVVVIPDEAIHVELLWNTPNDPDQTDEGPEAGADVDLHFAHPFAGGPDLDGDGAPDGWFDQPFDCFWFNPNPMWGSFDPAVDDDPSLDRDDTDGAGPENLNLNIPENNKSYRVGVHYWHDHNYGPSYVTVRVYIYAQLMYELSDVKLINHDMWEVCNIDWPSGNVSQVCSTTSQEGQCQPKITPDYENPFFFQP